MDRVYVKSLRHKYKAISTKPVKETPQTAVASPAAQAQHTESTEPGMVGPRTSTARPIGSHSGEPDPSMKYQTGPVDPVARDIEPPQIPSRSASNYQPLSKSSTVLTEVRETVQGMLHMGSGLDVIYEYAGSKLGLDPRNPQDLEKIKKYLGNIKHDRLPKDSAYPIANVPVYGESVRPGFKKQNKPVV